MITWLKVGGGLLAVVFIGLAVLTAYYWQGLLPPAPTSQSEKLFVISPGESLTSVTRRLEEAGLIKSRYVFLAKTKLAGLDKNIQAGDFKLSPRMTVGDILDELIHGRVDVWVTIIPGMRLEEALGVMKGSLNVTPAWQEYFQSKEGYLLPDSYLIPRDATAAQVWQIIEKNFNKNAKPVLSASRPQNLTAEEILIIASLVERETKQDGARQVAAVLLNRLQADWPLQVDATVQYALAGQQCRSLDCDWWQAPTAVDLRVVESPYNTYKNKGLPPSSIANPSLQSIEAVMNAPDNSPFWYYLSDREGQMHFSKTLAEHEEKITRFHR